MTTADGYILTMHRITGRRRTGEAGAGGGNDVAKKPAVTRMSRKWSYFFPKRCFQKVLVNHGLLCSSADWVMGSPDKSLGI